LTVSDITSRLPASPASYLQAARTLDVRGLIPLRLAVLSTYSAQFLQPYLTVEGAVRGFAVTAWFGAFGQIEQEALDASGGLYAQEPDAVVILTRLEDLAPALVERSLGASEEVLRARLGEVKDRLAALIGGLRKRTDKPVFIANFAPPARLAAGLAEPLVVLSPSALARSLNDALATICRAQSGVFVFDYARLVMEHGLRAWTDERLFFLARIPFTAGAQIALAKALVRTVRAALVPPAKVLVIDLDQTLWGGVLGEDGFGGIALGDEYPGNVFKAFQKYVGGLKDRGILLAIASKNNEAEVLEVFARHPDCILKRDDFAAVRINWQEKSASLRELAAELNVGLDACVFFDDSPFEREEVRRRLPMVTVIEVPVSPLQFSDAIEESGAFDQLSLSAEDRQRVELYRQRGEREEASRGAGSPAEFLASLEMVATIGKVGEETLPRVAQLLAKTNQFNLTTRRHGAGEIEAMMRSGAVALWLRLADRFGDSGLVGAALARPDGERWVVDTFLLSCRVIGRGVETALLAQLAVCVEQRGGRVLVGEYLPTAKNGLVAEFYARHGFDSCGDGMWQMSLAGRTISHPPHIQLRFDE